MGFSDYERTFIMTLLLHPQYNQHHSRRSKNIKCKKYKCKTPLDKSFTWLRTRVWVEYIADPFDTRWPRPLLPKCFSIFSINALVLSCKFNLLWINVICVSRSFRNANIQNNKYVHIVCHCSHIQQVSLTTRLKRDVVPGHNVDFMK